MTTINRFLAQRSFDTQAIFKISTILFGMVVLATVVSQGIFLQPRNLVNLLSQNAILMIVSLGQLLIILLGGIDLSVGAVMAMASVLFVLYQDLGIPGAFALALGIALVFGLINGFMVTYIRLPAFVVTLATMQVGYSISKVFSGGGAVYTGLGGAGLPLGMKDFYQTALLGIPYPLVLCLVLAGLTALYFRSSWGHFIYTVGGNQMAAFLSGVPVRRVKIMAYIFGSLLAGLGGILFVARVGMGDPQAGTWVPLDSIAAVSIGGASLSGGVGTVAGTIIGVIILSVLNNIMNLLGVPPTLQPAIKGVVIVIAVYLNSNRKAD